MATKLARPDVIAYCDTASEDEDNARFMTDCSLAEQEFGMPSNYVENCGTTAATMRHSNEKKMTDIAEKLDKLIEVLSRPAIPADRVLWDAAAAGAYLGVSARHVAERYALSDGFPDTIRLPSEHGRGQLRWKASEVMAWAERQRPKTVPRSRKAA